MKTSITQLLIKSTSQLKGYFSLGIFLILIIPNFGLFACDEANNLTPDNKDSTQNDPCKTNHTGDVCFKNAMSGTVTVHIDGGGFDSPYPINIGAGQIGCYYELKAGSHSWDSRVGTDVTTVREANVKIIECKSDTIEIK